MKSIPAQSTALWRRVGVWIIAFAITTLAIAAIKVPLGRIVADVLWRAGRALGFSHAADPFQFEIQNACLIPAGTGFILGVPYFFAIESRLNYRVARWIWTVPAVLVLHRLLSWHPPIQHSVLYGGDSSGYVRAHVTHFTTFLTANCRNFGDLLYVEGCADKVGYVGLLFFWVGLAVGTVAAPTRVVMRATRPLRARAKLQVMKLNRNSLAHHRAADEPTAQS